MRGCYRKSQSVDESTVGLPAENALKATVSVSGLAQSRTRSRSIGHVTRYGDVTASIVRTNESTRRQHRPPTHAVTPRSVAVRAPAPRTCAASSIVYFVLCLSPLLFTCVQFIRYFCTHRGATVNKPETNDMVIIARWPLVSHTAFSYSTYLRTTDDTSLAIADDLLRCDWLGRLG